MPVSVNHLTEFSKLLLGVLSLRRLVYKNYQKMNIILKEKQKQEIAFLDVYDDGNDLTLRSDSTSPSEGDEVEDEDNTIDCDLEAELLNIIDGIDDHDGDDENIVKQERLDKYPFAHYLSDLHDNLCK